MPRRAGSVRWSNPSGCDLSGCVAADVEPAPDIDAVRALRPLRPDAAVGGYLHARDGPCGDMLQPQRGNRTIPVGVNHMENSAKGESEAGEKQSGGGKCEHIPTFQFTEPLSAWTLCE